MTQPKFKGKYRIESTRLPNRNYAANGWYFVTICTCDRICFLGDVNAGQVQLSTIGEITQQFWTDIPNHFDDTYIDAYVIMPNHVHGIIVIDRATNIAIDHLRDVETRHPIDVETRHGASLQRGCTEPTDEYNKFAPLKRGSLSVIINAYKSSVTRWCHKNGHDHFGWQTRFYDHIIRADGSLDQIREYIFHNPAKWELDKNNPANLWM
ncbi:transposase [Mastigocladopsis repens]|uniref:transposase n=1 Tax=Mastigocladopsis repens TaxID=221287 RepID=UPI000474EA13|nr:transposase [Mastigocladopsis repens]